MSQSNKNKKLIKGKNGEIGYTVDTSYAANSGTDRLLPSVNSNGNQSPLTYSNFLADANGAAPTSTLVSGSVGNNYSVARTKFSSETGGEVGGETGAEPGSEAPANDLSYLEYKKGVGEKLTEEHQDILDEIEKARQQNITYAENVKSDAYSKAMSNEQKALIDSENSYARNLSTYGAKADALASMGLSGSGYSEFLDSQAYAAHRNDVNAAIAQRSESERAADTAYNDALRGINTETDKAIREENSAYRKALATNENEIMTYKEGMFNNVLKGIQDGTYSKEQIEKLAGLYEFTPEQQAMLDSAADEYANLKKEEEEEAVANDIIKDIYTDPYGINTGYVDALYNNGKGVLSNTKYAEIKDLWLKELDTSESTFAGMTKADAEKMLNNPWLEGTEQKKKLQEVFDKLYTAKTYDKGIAYSDDEDIDELANEGNEFDVVYDGKEYDVESGGEITDSNILELGKNVADSQLFGSGDRIFVKKDGRVFEIRGRGNTTTNDWADLTDLFFEKTPPEQKEKQLQQDYEKMIDVFNSDMSNEEKYKAFEKLFPDKDFSYYLELGPMYSQESKKKAQEFSSNIINALKNLSPKTLGKKK